jgi:hypothetical protein
VVFRLLDAGVVTCDTSSEDTCSTYQLSYSPHSAAAVAEKLAQLQTGDDPAFLSIAEGALADYAETPNYSRAAVSVAERGPGMYVVFVVDLVECFIVQPIVV